ncbi:hypothetical protein AGLY_014728 [Aphis glycines]|uniref:Uncharacterized protein n=1 Tax=Aphis glycines TaxID=307491 RepID=A0A6G0T2P7_APHGL|nr:hypothetical protein AGLY_014728 [Aphis glycines]
MCSCTCRYEGCSCTDERRRFRPGPPESSAARSKVSVSPKKIVFLLGESDPDRTIPRLRRHMKEIAYVAPYRYNPVQCPVCIKHSNLGNQLPVSTYKGREHFIPPKIGYILLFSKNIEQCQRGKIDKGGIKAILKTTNPQIHLRTHLPTSYRYTKLKQKLFCYYLEHFVLECSKWDAGKTLHNQELTKTIYTVTRINVWFCLYYALLNIYKSI